jgi:hypothetical protein
MEYPRLIENTTRYYLSKTLNQCHSFRVNIYYYVLNISVLIILVLGVGATLYYCSKGKLTEYEKQQKIYQDQQYVLSKIRYYKDTKAATGLNGRGEYVDTSLRGNHIEAVIRGSGEGDGFAAANTSNITNLPSFPSYHSTK